MIKLGLLFMAVTIFTGVNYAIAAYNEMMGETAAPQAVVVHRSPTGEMEIGVLGERLTVPDPVGLIETRLPALQAHMSGWQARITVYRARVSAWRDHAAGFLDPALDWLNRWRHDRQQQKKPLVMN